MTAVISQNKIYSTTYFVRDSFEKELQITVAVDDIAGKWGRRKPHKPELDALSESYLIMHAEAHSMTKKYYERKGFQPI